MRMKLSWQVYWPSVAFDKSLIAVWISAHFSGYDGQFSFADIGQGTVVTLWYRNNLSLHFMIFVTLNYKAINIMF